MHQLHWRIAFATTIVFTNLAAYPLASQAASSAPEIAASEIAASETAASEIAAPRRQQLIAQAEKEPPPPPETPPPGRITPGGGLGSSNPLCPETDKPLTAIALVDSPVKTSSDYPTFWFYIPYSSSEVSEGEFSVLVADETEYVRQARFALPDRPGIVSISLPASEQYALEKGKYYHWYLRLNCNTSSSSESDPEVNAWVLRSIPSSAPNSSDFWYDAVNDLANRRLADPDDPALVRQWRQLLESSDLEELQKIADEELIGPLRVLEE